MTSPIVYAISDLHGNLPKIPSDAEVLLIAGDICPDFRPRGARNQGYYVARDGQEQARWLGTIFREWLKSRPQGCEVFAIWGNHDFVGEHPHLLPPNMSWTLLKDNTVTYQSKSHEYYGQGFTRVITIHGTPWVPGLPGWAFYGTDRVLRARSEAIPATLDILLTHGPPFGAGDFIPGGTKKQVEKYGNLYGKRVGDNWLRDTTLDQGTAPKILICGHIHEDRGVHVSGATDVYNVAAVDENYELRQDPWMRIPL